MEKGCGLLVHITSLPSKHGIGTFGKEAYNFVDFLVGAKQKYWQVLPLNPTSYGDSPYASFSAFALNPYFIDLDVLVDERYLLDREVKDVKGGTNPSYVDYGKVYEERFDVLYKAYYRAYPCNKISVHKFYMQNKFWLEDYAMFMTIKKINNGAAYVNWEEKYRKHKKEALEEVKFEYHDTYVFYIWMQFEAYRQYFALKQYANNNGIKIIGDMPIYVAGDSSDVWGNAKYFKLDRERRPLKVAGVPPDAFSATGQLWGNPIYDWDALKKSGYTWWKKRFGQASKLYDLVRIDHFRGFESYWEIDAKEETAMNGVWMPGPGKDLFIACKEELSKVEVIAEDLGVITKEVRELKDAFFFPGMKVVQFAFDDYEDKLNGKYSDDEKERFASRLNAHYDNPRLAKEAKLVNAYLPHNYEEECVGYIGTHDNDIMQNYIDEHPHLQKYMMDYLNITDPKYINDTLIGSLMRSKAKVVIYQIQDILHMSKYSRINTPGVAIGNWQFRFLKSDFSKKLQKHLASMVEESKRN